VSRVFLLCARYRTTTSRGFIRTCGQSCIDRARLMRTLAGKLRSPAPGALSQGREDAYGAATSRAEAQVLRLSAIYAALDRSPIIDACHLEAALAVWDYCHASARLLFDTAPIDPTAQRISQALDVTPVGLSRVQIRVSFIAT
jgi:hypothetical protein